MHRMKVAHNLFRIGAAMIGALLATSGARGEERHVLESVRWNGQAAYRLSDGRTEAVIVPAWGRVMRYGFVGGPNLLWNAAAHSLPAKGFQNRGGAKTWPAPQGEWPAFTGDNYPPHPTWDGAPMQAQVLPATPDRLRLTSGKWSGLGVRLTLEFGWSAQGAFEIVQTLQKVEGETRHIGLWSVVQVPHPDALFLPKNPSSQYNNGLYWFFHGPNPAVVGAVTGLSPTLLRVQPMVGKSYKVGVDAPHAAIASVTNGVALVMRAPALQGSYPDGADGAGFPVECYNQEGDDAYNEMELLSPLYFMRRGDSRAHTVRWSLHKLTAPDLKSPAFQREMEALLNTEE